MPGSLEKDTTRRTTGTLKYAWRLYWLLVAAALFVFALMQFWTLPKLQAGAMPPFDLRYLGYSLEEARAYLAALGDEGRTFYHNVQLVLDRIYPALYGPALAIGLIALDPKGRGGGWGWLLAVFAIAGMGFDWLENSAISKMLIAGPDGLTGKMVADASSWTLLKSASLSIALAGLVVLLLVALPRLLRRKEAAKTTGAASGAMPAPQKPKPGKREEADV